jgi:hypothetical protein
VTVFAAFQQISLLDIYSEGHIISDTGLSAPPPEGYHTFQGPHILYDRPSSPA